MATLSSRIAAPAAGGHAWLEGWLTSERLAPLVTGVVILAIWQVGVSATLLQRFLSGTISLPDQLLLKAMDLVVDGSPAETPALAQPQAPKGPAVI
jgi:hypothetical protein